MPLYIWKCKSCGGRNEGIVPASEIGSFISECPYCHTKMVRDWAAEAATNTFHPSRDLYAERQKARIARGTRVQYEKGE